MSAEAAAADPSRIQARAASPEASVWVAASAGTGKTKVLTDRVLRLLLDGNDPARILCLTFTRAAAAEMSIRLTDALGKWAVLDEPGLRKALEALTGARPTAGVVARARMLFACVLEVPGGMKIMTIHAFCASLLGRFPLEAGVPPHFQEMDERTAREALAFAANTVLTADHGGDPAIAAAVDTVIGHVAETRFHDLIDMLARGRGRIERLTAALGVDGLAAEIRRRLGLAPDETAGRLRVALAADGMFDAVRLRGVADAMLSGSRNYQTCGAAIARWLAAHAAERADTLEAYGTAFLNGDGDRRGRPLTNQMKAQWPGAEAAWEAEADRVIAALERIRAAIVADASVALVRFGQAVLDAYERHKAAQAWLDYDDLILKSRALLDGDGAAQWVLYKLDGGIDHMLVDEAQDTSPDQWRVVQLIAEEFFAGDGRSPRSRTLFAVGDLKQSIFSFQGADPDAFERMRGYFAARAEAAGMAWDEVPLSISFRSTDAVLRAVDHVFSRLPARDGLGPAAISHSAHRRGQAGLVELWPVVEPAGGEESGPWPMPDRQRPGDSPSTRMAAVIAGRIRRWIDQGEILASKNRPIRAGDVMVLVRRRGDFAPAMVRALKDRNVPVAGIDRMKLAEQIAVQDLVALGNFLLLPDDELMLATVLKSPLIGFDEDALFALAAGRRHGLWQSLRARAAERPDFAAAEALLSHALARTDFVPPYELFAELLSAPPWDGRVRLLSRLGPDALDPIEEFLSLALAYERTHAPSLQGFLAWFAAGQSEIKRDLEQGSADQVRVMTVHGAKGLQAPIVFLPDAAGQPPNTNATLLWDGAPNGVEVPLWVPYKHHHTGLTRSLADGARNREAEEYRRLLYVAMTRAEDRLYVTGWGGHKAMNADCWYRLVEGALAEIAEPADFDFTADDPAAGWQGSGWRLATDQSAAPEDDRRAPAAAVTPDWDHLPDWANQPPAEEPPAPRPLAPSRGDAPEPPVIAPLGGDDGTTFRRGLIVHRLLQALPDVAPAARAATARRYLAHAAFDLDEAAREALIEETLGVIDHPTMAALFAPGSRAEVPIVGRVGSVLVSGQVDRLVVTRDAVLIADYKTNRPPPRRTADIPTIYLRQLAAYRAVLRQVYPEKSVRCALVWTVGPDLMDVPAAALDGLIA